MKKSRYLGKGRCPYCHEMAQAHTFHADGRSIYEHGDSDGILLLLSSICTRLPNGKWEVEVFP